MRADEHKTECRWCGNDFRLSELGPHGMCCDCHDALEDITRATQKVRVEFSKPEQY